MIDLRLCGTPEHSFKGIDMLLLHNGQWVFNMAAYFSCLSHSQPGRLTTITHSPTRYILSSQKLVYITSTQKAVCTYFMKQVLYILKACDVVHCQRVFSCYARVIMLRASCLMLEIKCHEVEIKESEKAGSDRESSPWHLWLEQPVFFHRVTTAGRPTLWLNCMRITQLDIRTCMFTNFIATFDDAVLTFIMQALFLPDEGDHSIIETLQ